MTRAILITGANKGIGLALTEVALTAHSDVHVLLGSRDEARGVAAREALLNIHPEWDDRVRVLKIDVTSDESVAAAAAHVAASGTKLYALVNNAGGASDSDPEAVYNLNFRGAVRVTESFLPYLQENGRIVNMSSSAGPMFLTKCSRSRVAEFINPSMTWEGVLALEKDFNVARAAGTTASAGFCSPEDLKQFASTYTYFGAKALLGAYSLHLARANPHLTVVATTPGYIKTDAWLSLAKEAGQTLDELSAAYGLLPPTVGTNSAMRALFGTVESGAFYGSAAGDDLRARFDCPREVGEPEYVPGREE